MPSHDEIAAYQCQAGFLRGKYIQMTPEQEEAVLDLRADGITYREIAENTGLNESQVAVCCRRNIPKRRRPPHPLYKLTKGQRQQIRRRARAGENPATLAEEYGVGRSHVVNIKNGHR
jgi:DNA invertase Pin-like site-specific DNA recombinase